MQVPALAHLHIQLQPSQKGTVVSKQALLCILVHVKLLQFLMSSARAESRNEERASWSQLQALSATLWGLRGQRKWPGTAGCPWPHVSPFLCQVVKACNEGVRKMSRTEQMISIQKKMEFKIKVSPSVCPQPSWAGRGHLSLVEFSDWPPSRLSAVAPSLTSLLTPLAAPACPPDHAITLACAYGVQDLGAACSHFLVV